VTRFFGIVLRGCGRRPDKRVGIRLQAACPIGATARSPSGGDRANDVPGDGPLEPQRQSKPIDRVVLGLPKRFVSRGAEPKDDVVPLPGFTCGALAAIDRVFGEGITVGGHDHAVAYNALPVLPRQKVAVVAFADPGERFVDFCWGELMIHDDENEGSTFPEGRATLLPMGLFGSKPGCSPFVAIAREFQPFYAGLPMAERLSARKLIRGIMEATAGGSFSTLTGGLMRFVLKLLPHIGANRAGERLLIALDEHVPEFRADMLAELRQEWGKRVDAARSSLS
jgi:hypothetical protein